MWIFFALFFLTIVEARAQQPVTSLISLVQTAGSGENLDFANNQFHVPIGGRFYAKYQTRTVLFDPTPGEQSMFFDLITPAFVRVTGDFGIFDVYMEPGDELVVQIVPAATEGKWDVLFQGKHHETHQLYYEHHTRRPQSERNARSNKLLDLARSPEEFKEYAERELTKIVRPFEELHASSKLSAEGLHYFRTQLWMEFFAGFNVRYLYTDLQAMNETMRSVLEFVFQDSILEDDRIVGMVNGTNFCTTYVSYQHRLGHPLTTQPEFAVFGPNQRYGILSPLQQQLLLASSMETSVRMGIVEFDYQEALAFYKQRYPESPFNEILTRIAPPLPDRPVRRFVNSPSHPSEDHSWVIHYQPGNMQIDTLAFIPNLKTIFRKYGDGKTRFVDFWATWCVPCIGEFSHARKLKDFFETSDIMPIYISTDARSARGKWEELIVAHHLYGLHILVGKALDQDIKEAHNIRMIPHYMIVDPTGQIAQPNAPRPSSGESLRDEILRIKSTRGD